MTASAPSAKARTPRRPSSAEGLVVLHLAVAEPGDDRREGDEGEPTPTTPASAGAAGERTPDAAQEPREGVGAQACGAVALGLLTLAPAALDADHETDGEGDRQPFYELSVVTAVPG